LYRDTRPGGIATSKAEVEKQSRYLWQCVRSKAIVHMRISHSDAITDPCVDTLLVPARK
jgi:hypothetical protein